MRALSDLVPRLTGRPSRRPNRQQPRAGDRSAQQRIHRCPEPAHLLAAWDRDDGFLLARGGAGLASGGTARAAVVPDGRDQAAEAAEVAAALLRGLEPRAVVVGALPVDGGVPARLWVPQRWTRHAANGPAHPVPVFRGAAGGCLPPATRVRPEPDSTIYARAVGAALTRIRRGELSKVVLARTMRLDLPAAIDPAVVLGRLGAHDPACSVFAVRGVDGDLLLGATPETLLRRRGRSVVCEPMAGSAPRSPDPSDDRAAAERLLGSAKDHREHRLVVNAVMAALAPFCEDLDMEPRPRLTATASVWHLVTAVRGRLREGAPGALGLAAALHPTPAVCGTPTAAALDAIHELEPVSRGLYSGLVGWVDAAGDGEWVVALRCAAMSGRRIRLYAGAGIVDGSVAAAEVVETQAKFRAMMGALAAC